MAGIARNKKRSPRKETLRIPVQMMNGFVPYALVQAEEGIGIPSFLM